MEERGIPMKERALCLFLVLSLVIAALPFGASFAEASPTTFEYSEGRFIVLQKGIEGINILHLQLRLFELGYYNGEINGVFDEITENAVKTFQTQNDFAVDGIATSELQSALFGAGAVSAVGFQYTAYEPPLSADEIASIYENMRSTASNGIKQSYVGNKNSMKFHQPHCGSVSQMKPSNKVNLPSRNEAILKGFKPCQSCNP